MHARCMCIYMRVREVSVSQFKRILMEMCRELVYLSLPSSFPFSLDLPLDTSTSIGRNADAAVGRNFVPELRQSALTRWNGIRERGSASPDLPAYVRALQSLDLAFCEVWPFSWQERKKKRESETRSAFMKVRKDTRSKITTNKDRLSDANF